MRSFIYMYFFAKYDRTAYGVKHDISLIIAIYMTQARICMTGLNLLLVGTRNKHMSRRLHVISRQGKGDRFMNVNPDRSPCALNLTPSRLSPPTSPLRERVIAIECSQLPSCRSSSMSETTTLMHVVMRNYNSEPNNHVAVAWVARKAGLSEKDCQAGTYYPIALSDKVRNSRCNDPLARFRQCE